MGCLPVVLSHGIPDIGVHTQQRRLYSCRATLLVLVLLLLSACAVEPDRRQVDPAFGVWWSQATATERAAWNRAREREWQLRQSHGVQNPALLLLQLEQARLAGESTRRLLTYPSAPAPLASPRVPWHSSTNCTTTTVGSQLFTHCN